MKLRNKKTGEIVEATDFNIISGYKSLAELNEEWEDAPEDPKEHYFITEYGGVFSLNEYEGLNNVANVDDYKQIANYFETKEEAEQAVEKLKAWKRLKDKGFRFTDYDYTTYNGKGCGQVFFNDVVNNINEIKADLDLLFGGEE